LRYFWKIGSISISGENIGNKKVIITTTTIQPVTRVSIEKAKNTEETEAEKVTCDILAVCDSLNRLCEVLSRLEYAIKRKKIEISLAQKRQDNNAEKI
jgi:hypothetical protein